jgi:hypothetical protein
MTSAAALARKFDLPVIPVHIRARNSALYYLFDAIHPTLRDITLFHETLNKASQPYLVTIGAPIAAADLPRDPVEATAVLAPRHSPWASRPVPPVNRSCHSPRPRRGIVSRPAPNLKSSTERPAPRPWPVKFRPESGGHLGVMEHDFTYHSRPGSLPLSLLALAGLILLAVQLWEVIPGFVLLVFIPALLVSIAELILTPIYGVRMSDTEWRIEPGARRRSCPPARSPSCACRTAAQPRTSVVLSDGSEIEMPQVALPDPITLIREVTNRGIPVRHA